MQKTRHLYEDKPKLSEHMRLSGEGLGGLMFNLVDLYSIRLNSMMAKQLVITEHK